MTVDDALDSIAADWLVSHIWQDSHRWWVALRSRSSTPLRFGSCNNEHLPTAILQAAATARDFTIAPSADAAPIDLASLLNLKPQPALRRRL